MSLYLLASHNGALYPCLSYSKCNKQMSSMCTSTYFAIAHVVPLEECLCIPDNEPAPPPQCQGFPAPVEPPSPNPPPVSPPNPQDQVLPDLKAIDPVSIERYSIPSSLELTFYHMIAFGEGPPETIQRWSKEGRSTH